MTRKLLPAVLALALVAGCKTPNGTTSPTGDNPYGVPTRVSVTLPQSIEKVISYGGGNVIAPGGGNVIAPGGGNYRTLGAEATAGQVILDNVKLYKESTHLIEAILDGVAKARPLPGKSYTFPDKDHPGQELTVLLEVLDGHGRISIGRGKEAKGEHQIVSIDYTSPTKGRAVLRSTEAGPEGKIAFATDYDLDAETASADGILDNPKKPETIAAHWEFKSHQQAKDDAVAFSLLVSAFVHRPEAAKESGNAAFAVNFLPSGEGAYIVGLKSPALNDTFMFMPADGLSWGQDPPAAHAFYMKESGENMPADEAASGLTAIVPADDDIYRPFPEDPSQGDPYADPKLQFPD